MIIVNKLLFHLDNQVPKKELLKYLNRIQMTIDYSSYKNIIKKYLTTCEEDG